MVFLKIFSALRVKAGIALSNSLETRLTLVALSAKFYFLLRFIRRSNHLCERNEKLKGLAHAKSI